MNDNEVTATILNAIRELHAEVRDLKSKMSPAPAAPGKLLSIAQAALYLGMSESFLRKATADGRIRPTRAGRRVLIDKDELDRLLAEGIGSSAAESN